MNPVVSSSAVVEKKKEKNSQLTRNVKKEVKNVQKRELKHIENRPTKGMEKNGQVKKEVKLGEDKVEKSNRSRNKHQIRDIPVPSSNSVKKNAETTHPTRKRKRNENSLPINPNPDPNSRDGRKKESTKCPPSSKTRKLNNSSSSPSSNWAKLSKEIGYKPPEAPTPISTSTPSNPEPITKTRREQELEGLKKKAKLWTADPSPLPEENLTITKYLAIDCEMVGVGPDSKESILAEIAIVNSFGSCVYHSYVKPTEQVTDWRTRVSGIRREDVQDGKEFSLVQSEVSDLIKGKIVVGHHLLHDFRALKLSHPFKMTRDTAKYRPLTRKKAKPRSLRWLSQKILNITIQQGAHSPIIDARASMLLYHALKRDWEQTISHSIKNRKTKRKKGKKERE
jgi:RNA exonuclease 4